MKLGAPWALGLAVLSVALLLPAPGWGQVRTHSGALTRQSGIEHPKELERRIFQPLFHDPMPFHWETTLNNWAAVCGGAAGMGQMGLDPGRLLSGRFALAIDADVNVSRVLFQGTPSAGAEGGARGRLQLRLARRPVRARDARSESPALRVLECRMALRVAPFPAKDGWHPGILPAVYDVVPAATAPEMQYSPAILLAARGGRLRAISPGLLRARRFR